MKIDFLENNLINFQTITGFESKNAVNEHGKAILKGFVTKDDKDSLFNNLQEGDQKAIVYFKYEGSSNGKTLFCGRVLNVRAQEDNELCELTLELVTETYFRDLSPHVRVYQNRGYASILKHLEQTKGEFADHGSSKENGGAESTYGLIVQYQETDWEFLKRLASREQTVLVADGRSRQTTLAFGIQKNRARALANYEKCWRFRNMGDYDHKLQNGVKGLSEAGAEGYLVKSREVFYLGDSVTFQGHDYLVTEVNRTWERSEVWNLYRLQTEDGIKQERIYNQKMIGAALTATVDGVEKDTVKVRVTKVDFSDEASTYFPYATVYSSPDGAGWYCMPEKDDCVLLRFGSDREEEAYVSSSVNLKSEDPDARIYPNKKSIRNKYGKEILFEPDKLVMTNNKGTFIEINDHEGIIMSSDKSICITADGVVRMTSMKENMQIVTSGRLELQQGHTKVCLDDCITMRGNAVWMQ